jgi:translocation and assembly module TamB
MRLRHIFNPLEAFALLRAKKIKILSMITVLCLALISFYCVLSEQTFYADIVASRVRDAVATSGPFVLTWESIRGNPFTGVYITNAKISSAEKVLIFADEIGMKVALLSVATPNTRLSQLSFIRLSSDTQSLAGLSLSPRQPGVPSPVDSLRFEDSSLRTPWGLLFVTKSNIDMGAASFGVDIEGSFSEIPISANCKVDLSGEAGKVKDFELRAGDMRVTASGQVTPTLEIKGEMRGFDIAELGEFVPSLKKHDLSGLFGASFYATNSNPAEMTSLKVSGAINSKSSEAVKIPFGETSSKFHCADGIFQLRDASTELFGGRLSGDMDVKVAPNGLPSITARIASEKIDTRKMMYAFPGMGNFAGIIETASCDLAGPINAISAKARLSSSFMNISSFPCSDVRVNLSLNKGDKLNFDFLGNIQGAPAKGIGLVSIAKTAEVSVDIAIPKISATSLSSGFPQLKQFNVSGDASVKAGIRGSAPSLSFPVALASREMSVMNAHRLSDFTAELTYAQNVVKIHSARAKWQDAALSAEGNVSVPQNNASPKFSLKGTFSNLNISRLSGFAAAVKDFTLGGIASGSWALEGDASQPAAQVNVTTPKFFALGQYSLADVKASIKYSNPSVNIQSASFRLGKGRVSASGDFIVPSNERPLEFEAKGSFADIDPAVFVSMGIVSQDISGNLTGDAKVWKTSNEQEPSVRVFFKNSDFNYADTAELTGLNGAVSYSNGGLSFERFRTNLSNGNINIDGTVGNIMNTKKPETVTIDLKTTITSADIDRVARIFNPSAKGFQGLANGAVSVRGSLASPIYTADVTIRAVRAFGLFLPAITFSDVKGGKNKIEFPKVRAVVGRGFIDARGSIDMAAGMNVNVQAEGTSVDIRSLTVQLENEMRREITGALDFKFEGSGPIENFKGKGLGHVPQLSVFGVKMSDVNAEVSVADGFVIVEDSSAKTYGGKLTAQVVKDLNRTSWGGRIEVKSADMASAFRDIAPQSEGSITGRANFSMQLSGDSRRTSMQDGNGKLEILNGEVSGFDGAKAVSKMIGGKPLRFSSALFTFSLDGHTIYIIPGSRVSAPQGDPVYKYVTLDGSVTTEQKVDLSCMGNINIRALNALVAGIQGVLAATVESGGSADSDELLKNFLGNTITGFSKNEFRDVSLNISGKPGDMKFSNVKIASPVRMDTMPSALKNPEGYKEDKGIKLKIEIPVGPGGSGRSDSVGGQIGGQLLDQLIKGLIFDDE